MILYNTTFAVDKVAEKQLIDFIKEKYIPTALKEGLLSPVLSKVQPLDNLPIEGCDSTSLALQVLAPTQQIFDNFTDNIVPSIFAEIPRALINCLQVFCTELDVLYAPTIDGESC